MTVESVKAYRLGMAEFAAMRTTGHLVRAHGPNTTSQDAMRAVKEASAAGAKPRKGKTGKKKRRHRAPRRTEAAQIAKAYKTANKTIRKAHTRDSLGALPKFAEVVDGRHRIVSRPPVIIPLRDLAASYEMTPDQARNAVEEQFRVYKATLSNDRRQLLDRFTIVDVARKVVGVGSVGTRAFMVLLQGRDNADPLFLQVKEATASVLEDHLPKSRYNTPGQRVVEGQRLMQAVLRHLPGLDQSGPSRPVLLLAPATRHEGLRAGRAHVAARDDVLRPDVRLDPRPRPRPIRRPHRHRRIPRHRRHHR